MPFLLAGRLWRSWRTPLLISTWARWVPLGNILIFSELFKFIFQKVHMVFPTLFSLFSCVLPIISTYISSILMFSKFFLFLFVTFSCSDRRHGHGHMGGYERKSSKIIVSLTEKKKGQCQQIRGPQTFTRCLN